MSKTAGLYKIEKYTKIQTVKQQIEFYFKSIHTWEMKTKQTLKNTNNKISPCKTH